MATQNEWLVIIKDKPDSLAKRMEVRPQHLENLKPQVEAGIWSFGGGSLKRPPTETEGKLEIDGSIMLGHAETREEIIEQLKKDIYYRHGVWDVEGAQIIPFKCAIRKPM